MHVDRNQAHGRGVLQVADRKRSSRPTRKPRGPRTWLRGSYIVWTLTPRWAHSSDRDRTCSIRVS